MSIERDIPFVDASSACVLLTGRNNEGKSNIILALKLLSSACQSIRKRNMLIVLDDEEYFKASLKEFMGSLGLGQCTKAVIQGYFEHFERLVPIRFSGSHFCLAV